MEIPILFHRQSLHRIAFSDENHDLKNALAELTRRYHELELENRRLENERQELAAAYKEAEAVSGATQGHRRAGAGTRPEG